MTIRTNSSLKKLLLSSYLRSSSSQVVNQLAFHTSTSLKSSADKQEPKKTILYDFHLRSGGKIVDFAGWLMPVQYKNMSLKDSHLHTRTKCSLFDVSHMMQTKVHGKDRFKYIESMTVSDVQNLQPNSGCLTVYTNENGGILDDLIISNVFSTKNPGHNYLYVVSNAGCADKDFSNMKRVEEEMRIKSMDVRLERLEQHGLLALQGPLAKDVLQAGMNSSFDVKKLPFMHTTEGEVFGVDNCRVTRCGYTGEDGFEISVPFENTEKLANKLISFEDGQVCKLAGLGARDTLRLEAGLCLYGNDIDEKTTPVEAGLAWTIHKNRRLEKNFPGAGVILNQLELKPHHRRVGLKLLGKGGPSARQHAKILDAVNSDSIGEVTSGCLSPSLGEQIAMGYVDSSYAKPGTKLQVEIRNKKYEAEVVKLPFLPTNYYVPK